jgi:hypothetical protein
MALPPRVLSGARAKVGIFQGDETPEYIGIFSDVSYTYAYDQQPVYILGRFSASSIDPVALETVAISATGWRVLDHGPFAKSGGNFTRLQDAMVDDYLTFTIMDRQSERTIATITKVRPVSAGGGYSMRQLSSNTYQFMGILMSDESGDNHEAANSMDLPAPLKEHA